VSNNKLKELKKEILNYQKNEDIASLFSLESKVHDTFDDEEMIHGYYANILDLALENLTKALEETRVMDMNEVQDFATIRALYEYAIEHYSAEKISDASALFEVLSGLTNDKEFSYAIKIHTVITSKNITLDDFLQNYADIEQTQTNATFYISAFQKKAQDLLKESQTTEAKK